MCLVWQIQLSLLLIMMSDITMFNISEYSGLVDQLTRSCVRNCQILLASPKLGDQGFLRILLSSKISFFRVAAVNCGVYVST